MKIAADILHVTESLTRLGGVETLVRQFLQEDDGSHAAALLDPPGEVTGKGWGLRSNKLAGEFFIRKAARARFTHAKHLVFHNFAGMMMLSDAIPHDRESLFLHTNSPDVFSLLPRRLRCLDSIFVSGRDLETEIRERFPEIAIPITAVEYPLDERYFEKSERLPGIRMVLGYSGRLENEQKQVQRLAGLCEALSVSGIEFKLEIAGSGSAEEELRRSLPAERCRFLGVLDPAALHEAYKRWDFLICTSDYETGPLVAMEAMAVGTIPILPDIPCQATDLIASTQIPLYDPGNMEDAAGKINQLATDTRLSGLRQEIMEKVADRRISRFVRTIRTALEETARHPAHGRIPRASHGLAEYLPFSLRRSGNDYLR